MTGTTTDSVVVSTRHPVPAVTATTSYRALLFARGEQERDARTLHPVPSRVSRQKRRDGSPRQRNIDFRTYGKREIHVGPTVSFFFTTTTKHRGWCSTTFYRFEPIPDRVRRMVGYGTVHKDGLQRILFRYCRTCTSFHQLPVLKNVRPGRYPGRVAPGRNNNGVRCKL